MVNPISAGNKFLKKKVGKTGMPVGAAASFVGWGGIDMYANLKQGDDFGTAAVKGAASGMLWTVAPMPMMAITAIPAMKDGAMAFDQWRTQKQDWWQKQHAGNFGGNYMDSKRALTMRQAAVQQIQGSKLNGRSALGGEAKILGEHMFRG